MSSSSSALGQLEVLPYLSPSLLLLALTTSLVTFILRRPKSSAGSIALPLHYSHPTTQEEGEGEDEAVVPEETSDPFNLYDPLLFTDGTSPDDGQAFYHAIKLIKIPLLLLLIALLAIKILSSSLLPPPSAPRSALAWSETIISLSLYTYLLALGISYVPLDTQPEHWGRTIHIAALVSTVVVVRSLEVLLPHQTVEGAQEGAGRWLPFVELGVATLAMGIVVSIPRGPELYFPMKKLYTS